VVGSISAPDNLADGPDSNAPATGASLEDEYLFQATNGDPAFQTGAKVEIQLNPPPQILVAGGSKGVGFPKLFPKFGQLVDIKADMPTHDNGTVLVLSQIAMYALKAALKDFYSQFNPANVDNIDPLLAQYKGQEESMVSALESKYGIKLSRVVHIVARMVTGQWSEVQMWRSALEEAFLAALEEFYRAHNPANIEKVAENRSRYVGNEIEMLLLLEKKYASDFSSVVHIIAKGFSLLFSSDNNTY